MPTYAYACTECGHQFDIVQSFSDDSLTTCPECSGRLRKQFNAVGVVFKGGGFYKTDSRSSSTGSGNTSTSSDNGSASSDGGSSSKDSATSSTSSKDSATSSSAGSSSTSSGTSSSSSTPS